MSVGRSGVFHMGIVNIIILLVTEIIIQPCAAGHYYNNTIRHRVCADVAGNPNNPDADTLRPRRGGGSNAPRKKA